MAIRCATKAIIIENGTILLNRCKGEDGEIYYDLPGCLKEILHRIAESNVPVYLGTEYIDRY